MKIVFIGGRDIHKLGGIENYMFNLATQLVKKGHEPIVFCESDHDGEEMVNGFRVLYRNGPNHPGLAKPRIGFNATKETIKTFPDVDLIHYNGWPTSIANVIARRKGIKTLMQGHGFGWKRTKYPWYLRQIIKFATWLTVRLNDNLIMCSKEQTEFYESKFGVPAPTVPTAINPPDLDKPLSGEIGNRFGLEKGKYFLFLARLVQDKNPNFLIEAFNQIKDKGYKLVIAGNNPSMPNYVEYLHSLARDNKNVIFTDAVYGEDKEWLLRNAAAFCLPSTIEGLSITLLEAMSYKLPIIASDIQANMEVLDKDKGLWVRPENVDDLKDALSNIIDDPGLLNTAIEYNYDKVMSEYTWDKVSDKYIDIVSKIIKK